MFGSSLVKNPVTGFLESGEKYGGGDRAISATSRAPYAIFNSDAKLKALELLKKEWPDLSSVCAKLGITRNCFKQHYDVDLAFAEKVDEIKESYIDKVEKRRFRTAMKEKGSFDRMCVLNAWRGDRYNLNAKIQVEHTLKDPQKRMETLSSVIDAEVVQQVNKIEAMKQKELREKNR